MVAIAAQGAQAAEEPAFEDGDVLGAAVAVHHAGAGVELEDVARGEALEEPTGTQFQFVKVGVAGRGGDLGEQFGVLAAVGIAIIVAGIVLQGKAELVFEVVAVLVVNVGGDVLAENAVGVAAAPQGRPGW